MIKKISYHIIKDSLDYLKYEMSIINIIEEPQRIKHIRTKIDEALKRMELIEKSTLNNHILKGAKK